MTRLLAVKMFTIYRFGYHELKVRFNFLNLSY